MKKIDKKQSSNPEIKTYSVLNNMDYCFRCTKEYHPSGSFNVKVVEKSLNL